MTRRSVALCAALCVIFSACGHYGPPVREHPETGAAAQDEKHEHGNTPSMREKRGGS